MREILDSALKEFTRADIEHAIRNAVDYQDDERDGNDRTFIIGPRRSGNLIEVGIDAGVVFHARPVSPKHQPPERRR